MCFTLNATALCSLPLMRLLDGFWVVDVRKRLIEGWVGEVALDSRAREKKGVGVIKRNVGWFVLVVECSYFKSKCSFQLLYSLFQSIAKWLVCPPCLLLGYHARGSVWRNVNRWCRRRVTEQKIGRVVCGGVGLRGACDGSHAGRRVLYYSLLIASRQRQTQRM